MVANGFNKIQNILLAVDGSEDSWAAVDMLREMPLAKGASIHVVSVLIPREASLKAWALMSVLEQTQERLAETGVPVTTDLLTGYPADEVMGFCEKQYPDLIMMGATGLRSTIGILLGGVAQQIVEYAHCPVLIVRAPFAALEHVLLVVDSSMYSMKASEFLTRFPLPASADVHVMHVVPPGDTAELIDSIWRHGPLPPPPRPVIDADELAISSAEDEERAGHQLLVRIEQTLSSAGIKTSCGLYRGDAATEILEYIKGNEVDVAVAGSRGLTQVQGWLLGSVSRKLVHYADCSVMIVKQPMNGRN